MPQSKSPVTKISTNQILWCLIFVVCPITRTRWGQKPVSQILLCLIFVVCPSPKAQWGQKPVSQILLCLIFVVCPSPKAQWGQKPVSQILGCLIFVVCPSPKAQWGQTPVSQILGCLIFKLVFTPVLSWQLVKLACFKPHLVLCGSKKKWPGLARPDQSIYFTCNCESIHCQRNRWCVSHQECDNYFQWNRWCVSHRERGNNYSRFRSRLRCRTVWIGPKNKPKLKSNHYTNSAERALIFRVCH